MLARRGARFLDLKRRQLVDVLHVLRLADGRNVPGVPLQYQVDGFVIEEPVLDRVDAAAQGGFHAFFSPGVHGHTLALVVRDFRRRQDLVEHELRLFHGLAPGHDSSGDHELDLVGAVLEILAYRLAHLPGAINLQGAEGAVAMPPP